MARSNLQIAQGTYTGNAADDRNITGVGFRPEFLIVKMASQISQAKTRTMVGDGAKPLTAATALSTNRVQTFLDDGFQIGSDATVNTDTSLAYYVAIRGLDAGKYFRTGQYVGTGLDDRNYTGGLLGFTPDYALVMSAVGNLPKYRASTFSTADSMGYSAVALEANKVQSLISNGFQVGTDAQVNASGVIYHWAAFKNLPGVIKVGSYTGTGVSHTESGIGFQPDVVIVKGETAVSAVIKVASMSALQSATLVAGALSNTLITGLTSDGFSVGTNVGLNELNTVYHYIALKTGSHNVPLGRTVV